MLVEHGRRSVNAKLLIDAATCDCSALKQVDIGDPIWLSAANRPPKAGQIVGVIDGISPCGRQLRVKLVLPVQFEVAEHVLPGGPPGYVRAEFTPVVGGAFTVTNGGRMGGAGHS